VLGDVRNINICAPVLGLVCVCTYGCALDCSNASLNGVANTVFGCDTNMRAGQWYLPLSEEREVCGHLGGGKKARTRPIPLPERRFLRRRVQQGQSHRHGGVRVRQWEHLHRTVGTLIR
jgi:hypothetical protein